MRMSIFCTILHERFNQKAVSLLPASAGKHWNSTKVIQSMNGEADQRIKPDENPELIEKYWKSEAKQ